MQSREVIIKQGEPKFIGVDKCKDMYKVFEVLIGKEYKKGNTEQEFFLRGLYEKFKSFYPKQTVEVKANQWKNKSSFEILKKIDRLVIIKYQKETAESEPKEIRTEINKRELESTILAIKNSKDEYTETRQLALEYCIRMDYLDLLEGDFWKNFFSNRPLHNKFTLILNALQELGFIEYKGGKTKLLNKDISLQLIL